MLSAVSAIKAVERQTSIHYCMLLTLFKIAFIEINSIPRGKLNALTGVQIGVAGKALITACRCNRYQLQVI